MPKPVALTFKTRTTLTTKNLHRQNAEQQISLLIILLLLTFHLSCCESISSCTMNSCFLVKLRHLEK